MIKKSDLKLVPPSSDILYRSPDPFNFGGDVDAQMLANIMFDRMQELGGIGLSANQVGLNYRMFVMGAGDERMDVFNPEVVEMVGEESMDEGCLTFPGVYVKVKRPDTIKVRYQNVKGELIEQSLFGLTARVFLHEYDHMLGLTMKERVSKIKWDLAFNRMVKRTKKIIRKNVQKQLVSIANQMAGKYR